jgi:predicted aldo/keto reductase-like oxidoreductase
MEYRINRKTGDRISVIGMGSSYISEADEKNGSATIEAAYLSGINYFDLAAGKSKCFPYYGKALEGVRKNIMYQIHFGANYDTGSYGWSTDSEVAKRNVEKILKELKTDYIDYGFIHCLDEISDWDDYCDNGVLKYLLEMKEQGVVKHIGLSSHTPMLIQTVLNETDVDMLMFSVNPGYDYHKGDYARGSIDDRNAVYRRCEAEGIGISVMKPFAGGQMLKASLSPFGKALTIFQCIQYALDKPGVVTVLPGMSSVEQVKNIVRLFELPDEERDYSAIGSFKPSDAVGKCVYCNHCKPCPMEIEIGLVNKYYDLSKNGDSMAREHYLGLEKHAEDCISCGHCDSRCPFEVKQSDRMAEIRNFFGQ